MKMNVKERGRAVATHRAILVSVMETVARWVPTTPEMEVKLLFGAHIWDLAQHADALGKRTHELRLPLQHSLPPTAEYARFLSDVDATTATNERIAALYRVLLPGLAARYRDYLEQTDQLMDAPTVRILERILADGQRMIRECDELLQRHRQFAAVDAPPLAALEQRQSGLHAIAAEPASGAEAGA